MGESKTSTKGPLLIPNGLGIAFADVSHSEWPMVNRIVLKGIFENGEMVSGQKICVCGYERDINEVGLFTDNVLSCGSTFDRSPDGACATE